MATTGTCPALTARDEMPSADAILAGLIETANTWRSLAIAWHLLFAALLAVVLAGWRLSARAIATVAVALVLSVSAVSWASGNPFNGTVFAALAVALAGAATRAHVVGIQIEWGGRALAGAALVVFGWVYPHFVSTESLTEYAYAAPSGLIPCPTLSVVIGLTLLLRHVRTFAWTVPLIIVGFFYGLVGVFALGVVLDVALLAGAVILTVVVALDSGWLTAGEQPLPRAYREGKAP